MSTGVAVEPDENPEVVILYLEETLRIVRQGLSRPVGRSAVQPGNNVVWDECECGSLYAQVVSIVGSAAMANPRLQKCATLYQARFKVGLVRCVSTVNDDGTAPDVDALRRDVAIGLQDRLDITRSLREDVASQDWINGFRLEDWLPQGPEGACAGGEITFTFSYTE